MKELFENIGIKPKDLSLYELAFTHSSYVNEKNLKDDYERLEYLGDAVLELVISEYLYKTFNYEEGILTKMRANYVCGLACSTYATNLNFSKYIKVSHGEEIEGGRFKKVILSDIFESFIGAIYLDLGFDVAKTFILREVTPYMAGDGTNFLNDYKSKLQELVQTEKRSVHYELIEETGPAHKKEFTMVVKIDDITYGTGIGPSKKEAEQEAAKDALSKMAKLD